MPGASLSRLACRRLSFPAMRLIVPNTKNDAPDLCGLWVTLHAVYSQWSLARPEVLERADIETHLRRQLATLSAVPEEAWSQLMALQGLSLLSLAAYSWCEGANLRALVDLWGGVHEAAKEVPNTAFEALRFTNPALLPEPKVSALLEYGFAHGWQMRLLSYIWAQQDVVHDVEQEFKPEIRAWFNFVKPQAVTQTEALD